MYSLLQQYLVESRQVFLQGFGVMRLERRPAMYDITEKMISPPRQNIVLSNEEDSGILAKYIVFLAEQWQCAEHTALKEYSAFCLELQKKLGHTSQVQWPNLGSFEKNKTGQIAFVAQDELTQYHLPVAAIKVIQPSASHAMTVGEKTTTTHDMAKLLQNDVEEEKTDFWWIGAALLGAGALVLVILKKMGYL